MRLYFETNKGQRLVMDTDKREYFTGTDIAEKHRFIWLESEKDIENIKLELDYSGWSYGAELTEDSPAGAGAETCAAADPARKGEP